MHRVFKLVSRITVFIFLAMLLYVYAFLPEMVSLYFDQGGTPIFQMDREVFFYSALGLFMVCTLVLSFLKRTLKTLPVGTTGTSISANKKSGLRVWADSLSVVLNLFFIFSISFVGLFHNDEHFNVSYFAFIVYIGPLLICIWIFYLIYLLLFTQ